MGVQQVLLAALLLLPMTLYAAGTLRLRRSGTTRRNWRIASFALGWVMLVACLTPPLETWSGATFAAHMVQHELLMLIAAPLLVLGQPLPIFLWAFPAAARKGIGAWINRRPIAGAWRALMNPLTGWSLHALALWAWHAPMLFQLALHNRAVHDLQHTSFVLTALLFWSGLMLTKSAAQRGSAILYLFTTTVHTGVLGALITFASRPWYAADIQSGTAADVLADQQLGGLIMWVPGSMVYVIFGLVMLLQWIRSDNPGRSVRDRPAP